MEHRVVHAGRRTPCEHCETASTPFSARRVRNTSCLQTDGVEHYCFPFRRHLQQEEAEAAPERTKHALAGRYHRCRCDVDLDGYRTCLHTEGHADCAIEVQYRIPAGWRRRERLDGTGHPHMEVTLFSPPAGMTPFCRPVNAGKRYIRRLCAKHKAGTYLTLQARDKVRRGTLSFVLGLLRWKKQEGLHAARRRSEPPATDGVQRMLHR